MTSDNFDNLICKLCTFLAFLQCSYLAGETTHVQVSKKILKPVFSEKRLRYSKYLKVIQILSTAKIAWDYGPLLS